MIKEIIEKINNKSVLVGVIGLVYVGLPMAVTIAGKGFDDAKLKRLVEKKKYLLIIENYQMICENAKLVLDTRNACKEIDSQNFILCPQINP